MNQVGRLFICIACGVTLSVTARGDTAPVTPSATVSRQNINTNLMNRIMMMRKHHHMDLNLPAGFPQIPGPGPSEPTVPQGKTLPPNVPPANFPQSYKTRAAMGVRTTQPAAKASPASDAANTSSGNPYQSIVTRNVFGLNPIPVGPPPDSGPTGPPPPKITLTGIMTIFGPAEALFKVAGVVRDHGPPHDESYIFTEGEMQDDVQVTTIDTNKMMVSFLNHGVKQDIGLTEGTASTGSAPSAPTWPGQPGGPRRFGRFFNRPGGPGGFQPQSMGGSFHPSSNYGSSSGFNNGSSSGYNNNAFGSSYGGSYSSQNNQNTASSQPALSPDDQAALIAAEHAQAVQDGSPTAILYPSTKYDQDAANEAAGASGGGSSTVTPPNRAR